MAVVPLLFSQDRVIDHWIGLHGIVNCRQLEKQWKDAQLFEQVWERTHVPSSHETGGLVIGTLPLIHTLHSP